MAAMQQVHSSGVHTKRRRGPQGFARTCSCFSRRLLTDLDKVADAAKTPRTVVVRILAAEAIRCLHEIASYPLPHIETCTIRTDVVLPRETIKCWRQLGLNRGLLGLSGLLNWLLNAMTERYTTEQLAAIVLARPDLRRIAAWLRHS